MIKVVCVPFVEIEDDRVFFGAVEVFGFIEDPFARAAVEHLPMLQLGGHPVVTGLLRIDMAELRGGTPRSADPDIIRLLRAALQPGQGPIVLSLDKSRVTSR